MFRFSPLGGSVSPHVAADGTRRWTSGPDVFVCVCVLPDFPMQLNMALFEFNGRTGYLLKHDVLRRGDKKFNPFCEKIDTVVASTLTIKVCSRPFT